MTRKDYEQGARLVRGMRERGVFSPAECDAAQYVLENLFAHDSPRFNLKRFVAACQPVPPKETS